MVQEILTHHCSRCGSSKIVKNGHNKAGNQQYHCKDCGAYRTANPKTRYSVEVKEKILKTYKERASMRGIQRIFGVSRSTLIAWLKKKARACLP